MFDYTRLNRWDVITRFKLGMLDPAEQEYLIKLIDKELDECFKKGYSKYLSASLTFKKVRVARSIVLERFDLHYVCGRNGQNSIVKRKT
jgi:hypothetical protein